MDEMVMGFDVGGTGARGVLAQLTPDGTVTTGHAACTEPLRTGPQGIDGAATAAVVTGLAAELLAHQRHTAGQVAAVAVGCAGALTMGDDLRAQLPDALARATGSPVVVICSDMVTSFLGALAGQAGVVLAVGTGAVAVGSDMMSSWRRVDGWGYLAGDLGGGAWIGRAGLTAALRAYDGRGHGSAPLLAELRRRFTDPLTLIGDLHTRDDRAAVLASFAPAVLAAAQADDPVAVQIQAQACRHLAEAAMAARPHGTGAGSTRTLMATTGALLDAHGEFRAGLLAELTADIEVRPAAGTACDGAVRLAHDAVEGRLPGLLANHATVHFPSRQTPTRRRR